MPSRRPGRVVTDERGAYLILFPVLLIVLFAFAALLLDLGQARANRRSAQSIADVAGLAAGKDLAASPRAACQDAVAYFNINAPRLASPVVASSFCGTVPTSPCATPSSVAAPSTTTGRYQLTVRYPVLDSVIADAIYGAGTNDGTACERMGVTVTETDPTTFGRVLGTQTTHATRSAVVKIGFGSTIKEPSLWLLDPTGCGPSLKASGGTTVQVGTTSPLKPGLITIDSDASACGGGAVTLSSTGNGTHVTAIAGDIELNALPPGATTCTNHACDQADVVAGRITPTPIPAGGRATRGPVDWRFNCKATYPAYHGIPIDACTNGTPAYIDNIKSAIGVSGAPLGYQRWTTTGHACNVAAGAMMAPGNWWIDCPGGFTVGNNATVTFTGGNLVVDGDIAISGSGLLQVNVPGNASPLPDSCKPPVVTTPCLATSSVGAAFVYQRAGNIINTGSMVFQNTVVLQINGYFKNNGGANVTWSAPTAGPFTALSLWSEASSNKFQLNGGGTLTMSGVFFTPEANTFGLSGGGAFSQLLAQFIAYRLDVSGGGTLLMVPSDNFISVPPKTGVLIR